MKQPGVKFTYDQLVQQNRRLKKQLKKAKFKAWHIATADLLPLNDLINELRADLANKEELLKRATGFACDYCGAADCEC